VVSLTGVKELDKALKALGDSKIKKVARSAISKAMRVVAKHIKQQIPPKYKGLKKAIGSRFAKPKTGSNKHITMARAGAAVGVKKAQQNAQAEQEKQRRQGQKKPGVGLSAANIHWAILGTGQRKTGTKRKRSRGKTIGRVSTGNPVRPTGRMPDILRGIVKQGFAASEGAAMSALLSGLRSGIQREANRK
jgi:hypothetical protein